VESFVLMDMKRQVNNLFQTPNILSTVFLVRICDTLYLRSGESVGPLEVSSSMVDRIAIITEKHTLDVATLKLRTQTTVLKYS
jgi:hypothetical protein